MNPSVQLQLACAPDVLYRGEGYTFWHGGITFGPHGLSLVVEVLDDSGRGRMAGDDWLSSPLRRWPVEMTALVGGEAPVRPHEVIEVRSPHFYRLISTFGRYGRCLGPKVGEHGLWLEFVVHPLDLRVTRHLDATGSGLAVPA
jgi:hypothetical protein